MADLSITHGEVHCSPDEVDYYQENLDRLDDFFLTQMKQENLQCASYLMSRRGKIFSHRFIGPQTPEENSPAYGPDSIRRIASMTKMFTSISILQLIEQGQLALNDSVAKYIPQFDTNQHRNVQIFHLLTHTSGVVQPDPGCMFEPYPASWFSGSNDELPDMDDVYRHLLSGLPLRKIGSEWIYSSAGFLILGDIIYRVSGLGFTDYVEQNLLKPLGMNKSFFYIPEKMKPRICRTEKEKVRGLEPPLPPEYSCFRAGGGLYSSPMDLWRLGQMLLNEGELDGHRFLGPHTVRQMRTNQFTDLPYNCWGGEDWTIPYGLGFGLQQHGIVSWSSFGHEGAGRCKMLLDPDEDLATVFFVPSDIEWVPGIITYPVQIMWSGLK